MNLNQWAIKWGVSIDALQDLKIQMGLITESLPEKTGRSEAAIQALTKIMASKNGNRLWRNNSGVAFDQHGVPVRFGLCNETPQLNKILKSSDLIGITKDGRFMARECKPEGWQFTGTDHEQAQLNFINVINSLGGDAKFTTDGT